MRRAALLAALLAGVVAPLSAGCSDDRDVYACPAPVIYQHRIYFHVDSAGSIPVLATPHQAKTPGCEGSTQPGTVLIWHITGVNPAVAVAMKEDQEVRLLAASGTTNVVKCALPGADCPQTSQ